MFASFTLDNGAHGHRLLGALLRARRGSPLLLGRGLPLLLLADEHLDVLLLHRLALPAELSSRGAGEDLDGGDGRGEGAAGAGDRGGVVLLEGVDGEEILVREV